MKAGPSFITNFHHGTSTVVPRRCICLRVVGKSHMNRYICAQVLNGYIYPLTISSQWPGRLYYRATFKNIGVTNMEPGAALFRYIYRPSPVSIHAATAGPSFRAAGCHAPLTSQVRGKTSRRQAKTGAADPQVSVLNVPCMIQAVPWQRGLQVPPRLPSGTQEIRCEGCVCLVVV